MLMAWITVWTVVMVTTGQIWDAVVKFETTGLPKGLDGKCERKEARMIWGFLTLIVLNPGHLTGIQSCQSTT